MNVSVGGKVFQFRSACFGLSPLPMLWTMLMKVLLKRWRQQGLQVFVYLDDILIIGSTKFAVERSLAIILLDLDQSGLLINVKKSQLQPTQKLTHLGFDIDFVSGKITGPKAKLASIRKELGKIVTHQFLSCRKMAAILGAIRSFLTALPMLRSFTDAMVMFVRKNTHVGWDTPLKVPEMLRKEVLNLKETLVQWPGRSFVQSPAQKTLHSDSSQFAWGGINVKTKECVQEFWRSAKTLHINVKEMWAAVKTLQSLSHPNEKVHLVVDNAVTYHYFRKGGGRKPHLNAIMRDFWQWVLERNIQVEISLVPSLESQADTLSRPPKDKGDYTLHQGLWHVLRDLCLTWVQPKVDVFASPGNAKLPLFISRFPHWESFRTDALFCPLQDVKMCYANPPWNVIHLWLARLRMHPHLTCLMITPLWFSTSWFPKIVRM